MGAVLVTLVLVVAVPSVAAVACWLMLRRERWARAGGGTLVLLLILAAPMLVEAGRWLA